MEEDKDSNVNSFRKWSLAMAESVDAWRLFPRALVGLYGVMVAMLANWFLHLETFNKTQCASDVLNTLLSKGIPLDKAQQVACTVVEVVGGPTTAQTAFVTAVIGLSTAIFAFYVNTGKDWSKVLTPWNFGKTKAEVSAAKILVETKLPTKAEDPKPPIG